MADIFNGGGPGGGQGPNGNGNGFVGRLVNGVTFTLISRALGIAMAGLAALCAPMVNEITSTLHEIVAKIEDVKNANAATNVRVGNVENLLQLGLTPRIEALEKGRQADADRIQQMVIDARVRAELEQRAAPPPVPQPKRPPPAPASSGPATASSLLPFFH